MKNRWVFPVLLIAPFVFAIFFWDFSSQILLDEPNKSGDETNILRAPQTIVENTELVQFNSAGAPAHWLRSNELLSDDNEGVIHISAPVINIDPTQQNSWDARSDEGVFDQQTNSLRMTGNVSLIKRQADSSPITMTTHRLDYFPDKNLAESNTPVVIETPGHRIETDGISVDFGLSVYKLTSNIRSSHDPI